jgi:hypothetical protein
MYTHAETPNQEDMRTLWSHLGSSDPIGDQERACHPAQKPATERDDV